MTFVASLPDSVRRELNRQRIRLDAADLYGSHAVEAFNRGDYAYARQFAVEAWHCASLAVR